MGWNSYFDAPLLQQLITAAGTPPIDQPDFIVSSTQTVASGATPVSIAPVDVARYQSLQISILESGSTAASTNWRKVAVDWYWDAAGIFLNSTQYYYYGVKSVAQLGIRIPVPDGVQSVGFRFTSSVTTQTTSLFIGVGASMRSITNPTSYTSDGNAVIFADVDADSLGETGIFSYSHAGGIGGIVNVYPQTYEGRAVLHAHSNSTTGPWYVNVFDVVSGNAFAQIVQPASASYQTNLIEFLIPRRPIWIQWGTTGTVTNPTITMVMTPW